MLIEKNGIEFLEEERFGIKLDTTRIKSEEVAQILQRKIGSYTTLTLPCQIQNLTEIYATGECLASVLRDVFLPYCKKRLCICGIGNSQLTNDSLGPKVVRKLALQAFSSLPKEYWFFQDIFGVIPEVTYYTNFPTEKMISGLTKEMQADCILLIDSMVTNNYKTLYRSIQLSTGNGLSHFRTQSLPNWELANIPIISLGIPMMIRVTDGSKPVQESDLLMSEHISGIMETASTIIAYALIRASWDGLSPEETFDILFPSIQLRENMEEPNLK